MEDRIPEGIVERLCKFLSEAALVVMVIVIGVDIATRTILNFSFEISDELGGYLLVAITFLSLSACQANDSFHHVQLIQARLPPRGRAWSRLIFDVLILLFCIVLCWQLARFELSSWRFGDRAPTYLATPLWIPRLLMVLGIAALCLTVARTLAVDVRNFACSGPKQGTV